MLSQCVKLEYTLKQCEARLPRSRQRFRGAVLGKVYSRRNSCEHLDGQQARITDALKLFQQKMIVIINSYWLNPPVFISDFVLNFA